LVASFHNRGVGPGQRVAIRAAGPRGPLALRRDYGRAATGCKAAGHRHARRAERAAFHSEYYDDQPALSQVEAITVSPPAAAASISAALASSGAITGQVTAAASGLPLQAVEVAAYDGGGD
jgi:hypothetical protein